MLSRSVSLGWLQLSCDRRRVSTVPVPEIIGYANDGGRLFCVHTRVAGGSAGARCILRHGADVDVNVDVGVGVDVDVDVGVGVDVDVDVDVDVCVRL